MSAESPRGVAFLKSQSIAFEVREYEYVEKGGTGASSSALGVNEHAVIKTLLFQESEDAVPFIVLQHGDCSVDSKKLLKELARTRGMASGALQQGIDSFAEQSKTIKKARAFMAPPEVAQQYTGYQVGGTSPFGIQDPSLRIFMEASLLKLMPSTESDAASSSSASSPSSSPTPSASATITALDSAHRASQSSEASNWDSQLSAEPSPIDYTLLRTSNAKDSLLDAVVTPAWCMINGGARGTLVGLSVRNIVKILRPVIISVAKPSSSAATADGDKPAKEKEKEKEKKSDA